MLEFRGAADRIDDFRGGNSVLCEVLKGLAVYASTLGDHYIDIADPNHDRRNHVRFFVLYAGPSRNQLGRLVDRVLDCGQNRIAALFEFTALRRAGDALRRLDLEIAKVGDRPKPEQLSKFRSELIKLGQAGRGGLLHRVGRSQHYAATLKSRIGELRIERIVGWQPYDEFVERNVEPQLNTLSRIGDRYTAINRALRAMAADVLTDENAKLQALSVSLAEQSVALTDQTAKLQHTSVLLTSWGIAVAILIAVASADPDAGRHRASLGRGRRSHAQGDLRLGCADSLLA